MQLGRGGLQFAQTSAGGDGGEEDRDIKPADGNVYNILLLHRSDQPPGCAANRRARVGVVGDQRAQNGTSSVAPVCSYKTRAITA